jgi:histidine triad (HIT) family protein
MPSVFTRIAQGEIPGHIVYEDEHAFAFLDINPRRDGHTLVVPRREVDQLFDLEPDEHAALWAAARTVATGLREVVACDRVCVLVIGYEIPHAHIHLIPTTGPADIPIPPVDEAATARLEETAGRVRGALS